MQILGCSGKRLRSEEEAAIIMADADFTRSMDFSRRKGYKRVDSCPQLEGQP